MRGPATRVADRLVVIKEISIAKQVLINIRVSINPI